MLAYLLASFLRWWIHLQKRRCGTGWLDWKTYILQTSTDARLVRGFMFHHLLHGYMIFVYTLVRYVSLPELSNIQKANCALLAHHLVHFT